MAGPRDSQPQASLAMPRNGNGGGTGGGGNGRGADGPRAAGPRAANGDRSRSGYRHAPKPAAGTRALAPDLLRGLLMATMALDHLAVALHTWEHSTGRGLEADGGVVRHFNSATAYVVRTLTHLCAPGFAFLLGMGVVYLGRSRARLGWAPRRLARFLAVRAAVLTLVSVVLGLALTAGRIWFFNIVLFALAVDYLLAGLLWLAVDKTERLLATFLARRMAATRPGAAADSESAPLLPRRPGDAPDAAAWSWHVHNAVLLAAGVVSILWNMWLAEKRGRCEAESSSAGSAASSPAASSPLVRIWFWVVMEGRVVSSFPPLAWLSFAVLGLVYGRVVVARPWKPRALVAGQALAGLLFALVFGLTRVLRVGNLSEGCLQTPAQERHPAANPYLVSAASFFYVVKYPPDVAFWAMTMAGNLFLLAMLDAVPARTARRAAMLVDLGTSALFFYVVHLLLVNFGGLALVALFGHDTGVGSPMDPADTRGIDSLPVYFGTWAVALWPACRAYSRFKSSKPADSVWRFF